MPLQWPTTPKGLPNGRVLPTVATRGLWGATGHQKRRKPPGTRVTGRRGVGEAAEKRRGAWFRFAVSGNWAFCFAALLREVATVVRAVPIHALSTPPALTPATTPLHNWATSTARCIDVPKVFYLTP